MESGQHLSVFQRIICNPGLSHIADDIFLSLDAKTLIECTKVCSCWKWFIIDNRILKRCVLQNKYSIPSFSSAAERSHIRQLLKLKLGIKSEIKLADEDREVEFIAFMKFVCRLDPNEINKRFYAGSMPKAKV